MICRIACFFLISLPAFAFELTAFPVLSESRYQRNQDQQMMLRPYRILAAGFDINRFSFLLERAVYEESYGGGSLFTSHEQTSYLANGRMILYEWKSPFGMGLQILSGVGVGVHQDRSSTTIFGSQSTEASAWESLFAAGGVARGRYQFFIFEIEGRVTSGKLMDPTFATGGVLRLGFIY